MSNKASGRIPDAFIQSVLAATDIVELIQSYVTLKKQGNNYTACCPFHNEKTPSFTVSPTKQFYHCFGCGANGDAIRFLMENSAISFVDALEQLAAKQGKELPKENSVRSRQQSSEHQLMQQLLNEIADLYYQKIKTTEAKPAVDYLKKRNITGYSAKHFQIGFAPDVWDLLSAKYSKQQDKLTALIKLGLLVQHDSGRIYDRFRNRIMFPIRNFRGDVIGFGGRAIDGSTPKYLNSSESDIFKKKQCLYGIFEAKQQRNNWQHLIVVEGYLDVITLVQNNIFGAVATLGTAVTSYHLQNMFKVSKEIIFCFDADLAGQKAAWKALEITLPLLEPGCNVKFLQLPKGLDPDQYINENSSLEFIGLTKKALPLSEFFFASLCRENPPTSIDSRSQLIHAAQPLIDSIPDPVYRSLMVEQLSHLAASQTPLKKDYKSSQGTNKYRVKNFGLPPAPLSPVYLSVALLVRQPTLIEHLENMVNSDWFQYVNQPGVELLKCLIELLSEETAITSEQMLEHLKKQGYTLIPLQACQRKVQLLSEEALKPEFLGAIMRLAAISREKMLENLLMKAKTGEISQDEKERLKNILANREFIGKN